ncbi:MAG: ATP synthase F1 subunit delta [Polyangiaceae bacterium]
MADEKLARRYAQAVFDLAAEAGKTDDVGNDLRTAWDAMKAEESAVRFFYAPVIGRAEKQKVLLEAFGGKMHDIAFHTLLLLVRKRRERLLPEILRQYGILEQTARGAEPLLVTSARKLPREELLLLVERLSRIYGKRFEVEERIDPRLLGGVRIRMGDVAIDGTVEGRLEELVRPLLSGQKVTL